MNKIIFTLLSLAVVLTGAITGTAQPGRIDTSDLRERQRQRQRAIEDPANNPFKIEPLKPLKPAPPPPPSPMRATIELQVVDAEDGDTLIIRNTADQHLKLRLQGIDAPEKGQAFSNDAKEQLAKLTSGKSVTIEFDPHGKPDNEGRIIAKVYLDGNDIGIQLIKAGLAWFCKDYKTMQTESDRYNYAEAEKEARGAHLGLWSQHSPQAPWNYRGQ